MSSIPSHAGNYDSSDSVDPRQHMAAATVAPASAVGASTPAPRPPFRAPPRRQAPASWCAWRRRSWCSTTAAAPPRRATPPPPPSGDGTTGALFRGRPVVRVARPRWCFDATYRGQAPSAIRRAFAPGRRGPPPRLRARPRGFADAASPLGGRLPADRLQAHRGGRAFSGGGCPRAPGQLQARPSPRTMGGRRALCTPTAPAIAHAQLRGRCAPAVAPAPASCRARRRRQLFAHGALSRPSIRAAGARHSSDPQALLRG